MATPPTMETSDDNVSKPTMMTYSSLFDKPARSRSNRTLAEFKVSLGYGDGGVLLENAKVEVDNLYMLGHPSPPGRDDNAMNSSWTIYDVDPARNNFNAKNAVANVYGTQAPADEKWSNWYTIEFVDKRFQPWTTLQVMGANNEDESDWAIVGGTGDFERARGLVRRNGPREGTQNLKLRFYCFIPKETMEKVFPKITKSATVVGGNDTGKPCEMEGKSQRLESVTISSHGAVEGFQFSYIDKEGKSRTTGIWGKRNEYAYLTTEIKFGPSEFVKEIRGNCYATWLCKFEIVTTHKTYGPFGASGGAPHPNNFKYTVPDDKTVVGFYAKTDTNPFVSTVGVYTIPKEFSFEPR